MTIPRAHPKKWKLEKAFAPAIAALIFIFAMFELSGLDLLLQDKFYNFETHNWVVSSSTQLPRLIFYTLPKIGIVALGVIALVMAVVSMFKNSLRLPPKRSLWILILTIITTPAIVGQLKSISNVCCPSELLRYGGQLPYVKVTERSTLKVPNSRKSRCFPAGHASGGFALFSLAAFARSRRGQAIGLAIGLFAGWWMGLYQMLRGAHYLSHTLITMMLAFVVFAFFQRLIDPSPSAETE